MSQSIDIREMRISYIYAIVHLVNPQWTWNEQSTWGVNSFFKEGIIPLTNKCDHDTEAGPSTGSSVAAAMLDIEQAKHDQR